MKKIICIIILISIIIIGILLVVDYFKNEWQGFYYPNGCLACKDDYIFSPVYDTKEECLDWATQKKISRNNNNDLYECGKNCKLDSGLDLYVCDETTDE